MTKLMKIVGITAVVALLGMMIVGAVAFAQGPEGAPFGHGPMFGPGMGFGSGAGFVDEDGDGFCDNCGAGPHMGQGPGFVDEDGDGLCDYYGAGHHPGRGWGRHHNQ